VFHFISADGTFRILGGQHIVEALKRVKAEMDKTGIPVTRPYVWAGVEIFMSSTPLGVKQQIAKLHNDAQHGTSESTFVDCVNKIWNDSVTKWKNGCTQPHGGMDDPKGKIPECFLSDEELTLAVHNCGYSYTKKMHTVMGVKGPYEETDQPATVWL
jgi:hypothetical protein